MAEAEVGDDVFGDDPTVNALEERAAALLGKDAALFVSSGTQGNLVGQLAHLSRGMETIAGLETHIVVDEAGGHASIVHTTVRPIPEEPDGTLDLDRVRPSAGTMSTIRSAAWCPSRTPTPCRWRNRSPRSTRATWRPLPTSAACRST